jgi:AcrR family transcriptional regulator
MATRTNRDRKILDVALKLFYERGFHAVGVNEIGEKAGVTGPAIYRHFGGKDELLAMLYNEALDQLFLRTGGHRDDPEEELEALIDAQAEFALEHRELVGIYTREGRSLAEPWRKQIVQRARQHMERWTDVLGRAFPESGKDEIASVSFAVVGLLNSVAYWPADALRTDHLVELLRRLVTDGLHSLEGSAEPARGVAARG